MSDTKLYKLKGKTRRNIIEDTPLEVKKYFDRKCGSIDGKLNKKELIEKELRKENIKLKEECIQEFESSRWYKIKIKFIFKYI